LAEAAERIEPKLGTFDTAMVVVSLVIGIGIFRAPAIVARESGSARAFLLAWILGGLVSLIGALTFAEIGSRHPRAGGYYRVVADCYHPALAFMLNWAQTLMQGAGAAGVAFIGAEYLAPLLGLTGPRATLGLACGLMLALLVLNFLGIRTGSRTQNVLSAMKLVMIVGLAAVALVLAKPAAPSPVIASGGLAAALVPVFYACGGYQLTMNLGADVKDARRKLPLAVTLGMLGVVALYLTINVAYVRILGVAGVAASPLVAASLARAALGAAGERVVSVAIFLSAAGFVNATILSIPRSLYAMAEDGVLPRVFARVNARTQVQEIALGFFAVTMLVPAFLLGSFEKLLDYVIFTDSLALVIVASTLFVLRRRDEGGAQAFRMPLYPLLPAIYLAVLLAISAHLLVKQTPLALAGIAIFLTGAPLFFLGKRLSGAPAR
jgi:APA family basic amino acid/polyamine antiporter